MEKQKFIEGSLKVRAYLLHHKSSPGAKRFLARDLDGLLESSNRRSRALD
jgi:hypothetical protein